MPYKTVRQRRHILYIPLPKKRLNLSSKIDRDKLVINDDGTITGLDEQITGLKTNYKDLFEATVTGKAPENHENVGGSQITKEQFNKMTYNERLDLYNKNPDLYHNLQE